MKIIKVLTEDQFVTSFDNAGRGSQFSDSARVALYEYLLDVATDQGKPYELDVIALCCAFAEYPSAAEAAREYGLDDESELDERTTVIPCGHDDAPDAVIIAAF